MEHCWRAAIEDHGLDHPLRRPRISKDRIPIVTFARPEPLQSARAGTTPAPPHGSRGLRATAALVLSALLAIGAAAGTWAAPLPAGLDSPIRAFGWPADGSPNDPYFELQTDLAPIGVAGAWSRTTGAPDVVVAVLDTGIDASNPEFAGRLVPGYNALTEVEDGPDNFVPTTDDAGHGTHISGTVAAAANNGTGIAGIAPNVSIMPIKVLGADGEGDFGGMIAGMKWAIDHGARIVTMSLGGELEPATIVSLQSTFDAAHSAGVIMIAASGNDGEAIDEYPCNFVYVICVGSTTKDGTAVSSFSTRTSALALVAPGERIASTVPGMGIGYGTGTSMATPHVTGAIALLRSVRPSLTPDEALASLIQSARPLVGGGHNADSGYGLLQVGAAVDLVAGGVILAPTPTPTASPSPSPSPTPDPNAGPTLTPSPTPDPSLGPVPAPELIVPAVTASSPRNGSRLVVRSIRPRITFSMPMVGVSTRTIRMKDLSRGRWVTIRVSYSASTHVAAIIPTTRLAANHSYRVTVSGVLAANDGSALSRTFIVTFRTGNR
jgi:serine protease